MTCWGGHRESNPDVMDHNHADYPLSYDRHIFYFKKEWSLYMGRPDIPNGSPSADHSQITLKLPMSGAPIAPKGGFNVISLFCKKTRTNAPRHTPEASSEPQPDA